MIFKYDFENPILKKEKFEKLVISKERFNFNLRLELDFSFFIQKDDLIEKQEKNVKEELFKNDRKDEKNIINMLLNDIYLADENSKNKINNEKFNEDDSRDINKYENDNISSYSSFSSSSSSSLSSDIKTIDDIELYDLITNTKKNYKLESSDIQTLYNNNYLNDQVINFYIDYLIVNHNKSNIKILNFDTFFFSFLSDGHDLESNDLPSFRNKKIFNWKKKIQKINMDLWIIPINENLHWSLVFVIYPYKLYNAYSHLLEFISQEKNENNINNSFYIHPDLLPKILYCDSLYDSNDNAIFCCLKYLFYEFGKERQISDEDIHKFYTSIKDLLIVKTLNSLPKQPNLYDCGIFLLEYVYQMINNFDLFQSQDENGNENFSLFCPIELSEKGRKNIIELLFEIRNNNKN